MIVGNGMVAEAFAPYRLNPNVKIFAAGVSKSSETRNSEFERERNLLSSHLENFAGCFVYFSTCNVHYVEAAQNTYAKHKLMIENEIQEKAAEFLIFRLPQLVGRSANPNTLTNYIHQRLIRGERFLVRQDATRSLLDVEHAYAICDRLISDRALRNRKIDVCLPYSVSAIDIVRTLERIIGIPAKFDIVPGGERFFAPVNELGTVYESLGIRCDACYVETVLRKYYQQAKTS
jgi:nucleoside-diphosphate-sugar epimerase